MKDRFMIKIVSVLTVLTTVGLTGVNAAEQPNVVVFLFDDLRPELGCYGNNQIKTPNIDALATDGVMFTKAYCQQAICAPSRMSLLTGLRPETIGIYDLFTPLRSVHKEMVTMPQFFKENGYTTVSVGKVYHHSSDDKESWSIHFPKEKNDWLNPENMAIIDSLVKAGDTRNGPAFECADVDDDAYADGRVARNAVETLRKIKNEKFMMVVGLSKPHLPFNSPRKYWDLYNRDDFQVPSRETPKGMYRLALSKWGELRKYYGIPPEGLLDDDKTRELIHGYYACVSYMDAQMARVMKALEELDLRKNTIVILMSDHGWKLGEYGAWCKHTNFELDVNVPMIISRETGYKARVTNAKTNALVENIDIFPTIAEACGLQPKNIDGKSILPVVDNPGIEWDRGAYSLYPRGRKIMGCTCTDGEWRYTEWRDSDTQEVQVAELYRYVEDNHIDSDNYSGDPVYKEVEERMKKLMEKQYPRNRPSFYSDEE